jgi:hypothetical protein
LWRVVYDFYRANIIWAWLAVVLEMGVYFSSRLYNALLPPIGPYPLETPGRALDIQS